MSVASEASVDRLLAMINGFRTTQVVYVTAKLGLADYLASSALTADELAIKTDTNQQGLGRVLRLAALYGLVTEEADGRFNLAPLGESLRSEAPRSLRPVAIQLGELHYRAWGELLHSVKTGKSAFMNEYGAPLFDYLAAHPDAQATFDAYMSANRSPFAKALSEKYDFSSFHLIVDVGGGNGSVSAAILQENPNLKAIILDRPETVGAARQLLEAERLEDRCQLIAGDFFESIPSGGDLYLLSNIIHDWDDERAVEILRNCRAAMAPNTPVILLEAVLLPHGRSNGAVLADVNMLVMLTGKERTEDQYASLFRSAGFRPSRTISINDRLSVIEALSA